MVVSEAMNYQIVSSIVLAFSCLSPCVFANETARLTNQEVEDIQKKIKNAILQNEFICSVSKVSRISGEPVLETGALMSAKDLLELGNDFAAAAQVWTIERGGAASGAIVRSLHESSGQSVDPQNTDESVSLDEKTIQIFEFDGALSTLKKFERHFSSVLIAFQDKKEITVYATSTVVCTSEN